MKKTILILLLTSLPVCAKDLPKSPSWYQELKEGYNVAKSALTFHASFVYNKIVFGSSFSFDPITSDCCSKAPCRSRVPRVVKDENGTIVCIDDAKKVPLALGSIPRSQKNIDAIKRAFNLSKQDRLGIYTLNRDFERNWAGLTQLEKEQPLTLHKYPTTDYTAPQFVDLLRAVRDLDNRDTTDEKVAYVHCKAGRGRSATAVEAYLLYICHKAGVVTTPAQVEAYIKSRRPCISMNADQKALLAEFDGALKKAGNFQALCADYKEAIQKRDEQINQKR